MRTRGLRYRGDHQRLEHRRVDGGIERLRGRVDHHVHTAGGQFGEPIVVDRGRHERLAGEILEAEALQLLVGRHHDVGLAGGRARHQAVVDEAGNPDVGLDRVGQHLQRHHGDVGRDPERGNGVETGGDVESQQRVGDRHVVGVLTQDTYRAVVVDATEHRDPGVAEEPRHLGLHVSNGPLLQDVTQPVPIRHRDRGHRPLDLLHSGEIAVVEACGARLADSGHRDDGGPTFLPRTRERLGLGEVAVGALSHDAEVVVQERRGDIVVTLRGCDADIDDEFGVVGHSDSILFGV